MAFHLSHVRIGWAILGALVALWSAELIAAEPARTWSPADFEQRGNVLAGPKGDEHGQLKLQGWAKPTLVDLRQSRFFANEDGPYASGKLPTEWPKGDAFKQLSEASLEEKYPVSLRGGPEAVHVLGGHVIGRQPRELPWRFLKRSYDGDAVRIESSGDMIVTGLYAENIEDVVSPRGSGYWSVRGCYGKYIRDDFVENDGLLSGEISDCLVDGCHVLVSNRPGKAAAPEALAKKMSNPPHVTIRDTLCHISKMPYDGDMKLADQEYIVDGMAGGKLFKWSPAGGKVTIENCVLRVDAMASTGAKSMSFPEGAYRNVKLIWLGGGTYPAPVPDGISVTPDVQVWNDARAAWLQKHSEFQELAK